MDFGFSYTINHFSEGRLNANHASCIQCIIYKIIHNQRAKKVMSDGPGLLDFTIGLVNSVLNFLAWQVKYLKEFLSQKTVINPARHWASENDFWASAC